MSLFDKKPEIPRPQFKEILKKSNIKIGSGKQLSERQKANIEQRDFPKRFGSTISKGEYARTLNRLKGEKINERDFVRKTKLGKEIKFLQELEKKPDLPGDKLV
jgi:hypothetical protein